MSDPVGRDANGCGELVLGIVQAVTAEVNPTRRGPITLDSSLERDLGLDSLTRGELLVRLEAACGARLPDRELFEAATSRDLVAAVESASGRTVRRTEPPTPFSPPSAVTSPRDARALVEVLERHAAAHPDRVHVHLLGDDPDAPPTPLTYGRLLEDARALADGLLARDVRPGDTVALMLPTGIDYLAAFCGVLLAGAVPVPIYPPARLTQLEEHIRRQLRILDNAQVVAMVTAAAARPLARVVRGGVESLRTTCTVDDLRGAAHVGPGPSPGAGDIALLQYTSGSTGAPKGVVLTHEQILANIGAMAQAARVGSEDVFVSWLPLYHDMGLIGAWLGSLSVGFPLVLMSPTAFLTRPIRWLRAIHRFGGTLSAAPNFGFELAVRRVTDADLAGLDLSSWRMAFNGAEPVSAATLERFAARFGPCGLRREALAPVYGLAEAAVGLAFPPPGRGPLVDRVEREPFVRHGRAVVATDDTTDAVPVVACGRSLPGYELRIVDAAGHVVGERQEGRVEFRGPSATTGYFRDPEATWRLFHDGWLDTGDLGYLADGDVHLTGRVKDLVIRAGRNLHPEELEEAVGAVAGVRRGCVAVFAVPDPAAGTEQLVVMAESRATDAEEVAALRARVVATSTDVLGLPPDDVVVVPPGVVLKTSSGKIRRSACRERYLRGDFARRGRGVRRQMARLAIAGAVPRLRRARRAVGALAAAGWAWGWALVLAGPLWLLVVLLPRRSWRHAVLRRALRWLFRVTGAHLEVSGAERLPAVGPAVVVGNHASWLDGAILAAALPRPATFVVAGELAATPWAGRFLRRLGVEFVTRADPRQGAADTRRILSAVRAGALVVAFPEGRLSRVPGLRPFHMGAFVVATECRVPVVPVAIRGSRSLLPPEHRFPRPSRVEVVVGEPLPPGGPGWSGAVSLQRAARRAVLARCGEPDVA